MPGGCKALLRPSSPNECNKAADGDAGLPPVVTGTEGLDVPFAARRDGEADQRSNRCVSSKEELASIGVSVHFIPVRSAGNGRATHGPALCEMVALVLLSLLWLLLGSTRAEAASAAGDVVLCTPVQKGTRVQRLLLQLSIGRCRALHTQEAEAACAAAAATARAAQ